VFKGLGNLKAEVFVIDNASEDGSPELVQTKFPTVKLIRNDCNRGFAAANNQALRQASGRQILLLNSDTLVHSDVLERSVGYMERHSDVGMMGCRVLNGDGSTQMTCSKFPSTLNLVLQTLGLNRLKYPKWFSRYQMLDWQRDSERDIEIISGCYLMARKSAVEGVGMLDENFFLYGEETDWCRRFAHAGWKLRFSPVGEITHFGSGSSKQLNHRRDVLLSEGTIRLHRKHGGIAFAMNIWLLLYAFNVSRMIFWTASGFASGSIRKTERANHFAQVVNNFKEAWPVKKAG
jgi:hypothetical protein